MVQPENKVTYTSYKKLKAGMLTWNLGGHPPPDQFQIQEFILPKKDESEESKDETQSDYVDLFVVGL